ncbi:50S ribosomal protein L30 [Chloroflexota bacterium]
MSKLRITWIKSSIGYGRGQRATLQSLGLRKINQSVEHEDVPTIRGMVAKVKHLIAIEEIT